MKFLILKAASRYRNWMYAWENGLANRSTDRVVRPFDFGLEWAEKWPCARDFLRDEANPIEYITRLNERAIASSQDFFNYQPPLDFSLERQAAGEWLSFSSPVETQYSENNRVHALWFPALAVVRP